MITDIKYAPTHVRQGSVGRSRFRLVRPVLQLQRGL